MPKLWDGTIEAHRRAVREATLDAAAALVARHGLRAVTMSQIAEETGIARATLYKYFPDVEAILAAWHERQVSGHLEQLAEIRDREGDAAERLAAAPEVYALIQHDLRPAHSPELVAHLHRHDHVAGARRQLADFVRELLAAGRGPATSGTTSPPTSWRATASTLCRPRPACPRRRRCGGSSRSPSPGCVPCPTEIREFRRGSPASSSDAWPRGAIRQGQRAGCGDPDGSGRRRPGCRPDTTGEYCSDGPCVCAILYVTSRHEDLAQAHPNPPARLVGRRRQRATSPGA
jgi:AcrR family transcriptional regulator